MAFLTPPIHASGRYEVNSPWTIEDRTYSCDAIRTFDACNEKGLDVYNEIYVPKGITREKYESDYQQGACLITLRSAYAATIYIPDSYIKSYPNMGEYADQHIILSVDLGMLKSVVDLTYLKSQVKNAVSEVTGDNPTVLVHVSPINGVPSETESDRNENTRQHLVESRSSDSVKLAQSKIDVEVALDQVRNLESKLT